MDTIIAGCALVVSVIALGLSISYWRKSFRPIVTAMVKTHSAGNVVTALDLELLNSGSLPAKNIRLIANHDQVNAALGIDSSEENQRRWLSCFYPENIIAILHNGERIRCSFGTSRENDGGFWKYKAELPITIQYEGWFGKKYFQEQVIQITDSDSFTGFMWS
jgi:hypothetical protein